jgi:hypothetical protein
MIVQDKGDAAREAEVEQEKPQYWFPVKRYGWGWGLPVRWQGWVVMVLYFASIFGAIRYFHPQNNPGGVLLVLAIATVILIAICAWKGEKPLAWRWGD